MMYYSLLSELYLGYLLFAREVLNRYMMVKLLQAELDAGLEQQHPDSSEEVTLAK